MMTKMSFTLSKIKIDIEIPLLATPNVTTPTGVSGVAPAIEQAPATNPTTAPTTSSMKKQVPPAPRLISARSRWKKLTGTAMFINRLGKNQAI